MDALGQIFLEKLMVTNAVNTVPTLFGREELALYLYKPIAEPCTAHNINSTQFSQIHFNILPPMPFSDNCHFHLVLSNKTARIFILFWRVPGVEQNYGAFYYVTSILLLLPLACDKNSLWHFVLQHPNSINRLPSDEHGFHRKQSIRAFLLE